MDALQETYYALNPWWEGAVPDTGIPRPSYLNTLGSALDRAQIEVLVGGRRVGKTTLVRQLVARCLKQEIAPRDVLYLALDHPRLSTLPISGHLRRFRALFGHERRRKLWLMLDEVQESPDWESELKAIHDLENVKLVCTGSTAALIASQGGKLTGRQLLINVYPLDFAEFLAFRRYEFGAAEEYRYVAAAEEYLETGGYPEQVLQPSEFYLSQLLDDVVARDLVRLGRLRRPEVVRDLLRLLAAGVGARTSYARLAKALGIAVDTVKEYESHLTMAYLIKALPKWTTSHTERVYAQRKVYFIDTGVKAVFTGKGDLGSKAEQAVFVHLLRASAECGYYAESEREVDFVVGSVQQPAAIEVKYDNEFDWSDRRLHGIRLFLRRFPACREVTVVTRDAVAELQAGETRVVALPLWRYLLQ
jgi:predicted AAA+ superfamily ATPase